MAAQGTGADSRCPGGSTPPRTLVPFRDPVSISLMIKPPAAHDLRQRQQQRRYVAADADVAVEQQRGPPPALRRQAGSARSRRSTCPPARRPTSTARPPRCRCPGPPGPERCRAATIRPGPQPMSSTGAHTEPPPSRIDLVGRAQPAVPTVHDSSGDRPASSDPRARGPTGPRPTGPDPAGVAPHRRPARGRRTTDPSAAGRRRPISSRWRREKRSSGQWSATASASAGRSTSRSGGSRATVSPRSISRPSWAAPVRSVDISTPANTAPGPPPRSPIAQNPPSSLSPSTASAPAPRRVQQRAGDLRGVHPDQQHPLARCPGHRCGEGCGEPRTEISVGLRHHLQAGVPTGRVSVEHQHSPGIRSAPDGGERVAQGGGGQLRASPGLNRLCSRVFARPGNGCLASTSIVCGAVARRGG